MASNRVLRIFPLKTDRFQLIDHLIAITFDFNSPEWKVELRRKQQIGEKTSPALEESRKIRQLFLEWICWSHSEKNSRTRIFHLDMWEAARWAHTSVTFRPRFERTREPHSRLCGSVSVAVDKVRSRAADSTHRISLLPKYFLRKSKKRLVDCAINHLTRTTRRISPVPHASAHQMCQNILNGFSSVSSI